LRSDFHRFFDSVDHQLLREKLEVYVQDDEMVNLLMQWVESGAPWPGRGLPTGAVISPLLANLFLDDFDRQVQADGGLLVRYADDFVLLFRDPSQGRKILDQARTLAEEMKLHLNENKTRLIDLNQTPFDFLGFRFFAEKDWQFHGEGLVQIEDLGWQEAPRGQPLPTQFPLPGEHGPETTRAGTWIVGPDIDWIGIQGPDIVCRSQNLGTEDRFQRRRVSELIVLGPATLDRSLFSNRSEDTFHLMIADDVGRWISSLQDEPPVELPQLVRAQVALGDDPPRRLALAKQLIAAKLRNYAALAAACPARGGRTQLAERLRQFADRTADCQTENELLGVEGAGAAAWYGELSHRIESHYKFERREHPHASDPINVLLNLTQTILHRLICLTLVREGFAVSIGLFHRSGDRHAALASDLQEPFRHLMDRATIEATSRINPGEFHHSDNPNFPIRLEPGAYRLVVASVFKALASQTVCAGQEARRSYRQHIATLARSLHRHLLNPEAKFKVFEYPY